MGCSLELMIMLGAAENKEPVLTTCVTSNCYSTNPNYMTKSQFHRQMGKRHAMAIPCSVNNNNNNINK